MRAGGAVGVQGSGVLCFEWRTIQNAERRFPICENAICPISEIRGAARVEHGIAFGHHDMANIVELRQATPNCSD